MKRNGLSVRRPTSVGQPLPPEFIQKISDFRAFVAEASTNISTDNIGNTDEVSIPFDALARTTVHLKGGDGVRIDTTGHEKSNLTAVLAVMASGEKLKPMLIFKKKLMPRVEFPANVVVKVNERRWMNGSLMLEWID